MNNIQLTNLVPKRRALEENLTIDLPNAVFSNIYSYISPIDWQNAFRASYFFHREIRMEVLDFSHPAFGIDPQRILHLGSLVKTKSIVIPSFFQEKFIYSMRQVSTLQEIHNVCSITEKIVFADTKHLMLSAFLKLPPNTNRCFKSIRSGVLEEKNFSGLEEKSLDQALEYLKKMFLEKKSSPEKRICYAKIDRIKRLSAEFDQENDVNKCVLISSICNTLIYDHDESINKISYDYSLSISLIAQAHFLLQKMKMPYCTKEQLVQNLVEVSQAAAKNCQIYSEDRDLSAALLNFPSILLRQNIGNKCICRMLIAHLAFLFETRDYYTCFNLNEYRFLGIDNNLTSFLRQVSQCVNRHPEDETILVNFIAIFYACLFLDETIGNNIHLNGDILSGLVHMDNMHSLKSDMLLRIVILLDMLVEQNRQNGHDFIKYVAQAADLISYLQAILKISENSMTIMDAVADCVHSICYRSLSAPSIFFLHEQKKETLLMLELLLDNDYLLGYNIKVFKIVCALCSTGNIFPNYIFGCNKLKNILCEKVIVTSNMDDAKDVDFFSIYTVLQLIIKHDANMKYWFLHCPKLSRTVKNLIENEF